MKNNKPFIVPNIVPRITSLKYLKFAFYMLSSVWMAVPNAVFAEVSGTYTDPNNRNKVVICHFPPGNPENVQTISISRNALRTHVDHHDDYDGQCNETPKPSTGAGHLRYADEGTGRYKDRILFMDWEDSSLEDGIQSGDIVNFNIPETTCMANGRLIATFSNVDDPGNIANDTKPHDMQTWGGASFYQLYNTSGKGEALYTPFVSPDSSGNHLSFTINWHMQVDGETVRPDIFLIDAESTTEGQERIDATTDGGYWSVIENALNDIYTVDGLGTAQIQIKSTEDPDIDDNAPENTMGWSPLLLSKAASTTRITMKLFNGFNGKEGVAFGLLAPCDHGDNPISYGDAGHAFKEAPISAFKTELGLKYASNAIHLGIVQPDSEIEIQNDVNALGDDFFTDYFDKSRDGDEDGVSIPYFSVDSTNAISISVTGSGYLQAWIDWNVDGDFEDLGERVATDVAASSGTFTIPVTIPADAKEGITYSRFRYSKQSGLASTGYAKDGEVEDYVVAVSGALVCRIDDIPQDAYTTSSLSANSTYLNNSTRIYQAKFNNTKWSGQVLAYDLKTTDKDGNIKSEAWNAANQMSRSGRQLFTYDPTLANNRGRTLSWDNLNEFQRENLQNGATETLARKRLAWLQGSAADEGTSGLLRTRDNILGDIIHSNLSFKGQVANYGYKQLSGSEGSSYAAFLRTKKESKESVFVGANDGMLHAFDVEDGSELFAYIPNEVYPKLSTISDVKYGCKQADCLKHEYLVDGTASLGDAYFDTGSGDEWHTVLLGALGMGGKGIFALDVTTPDSFSSDDVLWEVSTSQSPNSTDNSEFANHMGYSLPATSVIRMKNGKWAALVSNGYDSASKQAVLFIIDIETGALIKSLNTNVGSEDTPNGLSTPTAIDSNGDFIIDTIYAGDLLGNMWSFDVSNSNADNWAVTFGYANAPEPLFRACEDAACTKPQMITAAPQVGRNPAGGLMVYFGTGKYFDVGDNMLEGEDTGINSFYGILDNGDQIASKNDLVQQSILQEIAVGADLNSRVTSQNSVDFATKEGWFMNLVTAPSNNAAGERVISQALLREGRLIFTTMTPPQSDCVWGGTSWLMELNALTGSRLDEIPFDTNNDKEFTALDNVDYNDKSTIISGLQKPSLGVIFSSPVVISHTTRAEGKYVTGTGGGIGMFRESASRFSGRMSWRKLR